MNGTLNVCVVAEAAGAAAAMIATARQAVHDRVLTTPPPRIATEREKLRLHYPPPICEKLLSRSSFFQPLSAAGPGYQADTMSTARVVLAEPDTPTRMGLRVALARCGFAIVDEAEDAGGAVEATLRERPDLVVLAADLPGDWIAAVRTIATRVSAARIVVLTPREDGQQLVAAVLAGTSGYLRKDVSESRLPCAVEGVLAGEAALPRAYTEHLLEALRGRHARRARIRPDILASITERQWEVLDLLADGTSTADMAHRLGISEVTARRHISSILPKLGVQDREEVVELLRES